jgi:hypothetical protein
MGVDPLVVLRIVVLVAFTDTCAIQPEVLPFGDCWIRSRTSLSLTM